MGALTWLHTCRQYTVRVAGPAVGAQLPGPHGRLLPLLILDADMMGLTFVCAGEVRGADMDGLRWMCTCNKLCYPKHETCVFYFTGSVHQWLCCGSSIRETGTLKYDLYLQVQSRTDLQCVKYHYITRVSTNPELYVPSVKETQSYVEETQPSINDKCSIYMTGRTHLFARLTGDFSTSTNIFTSTWDRGRQDSLDP